MMLCMSTTPLVTECENSSFIIRPLGGDTSTLWISFLIIEQKFSTFQLQTVYLLNSVSEKHD